MIGGAELPYALVAHARDVPACDREYLAARIALTGPAGLLLHTCHRVELYASDAWTVRQFGTQLPPGVAVLSGDDAVRHAISVAMGLDSVMVGEDQILHQLRAAAGNARRSGSIDQVVDRLVSLALHAGRRARSWRSGPPLSLADAALAVIERRTGSLAGRRVLVVGAGEMGLLAANAARSKEAIVTLTSRTAARARATAQRAGVQPVAMDPGAAAGDLAAVVVAIRGAWELGVDSTSALVHGTAVVVDMSVPTALPTSLAIRLGERFVSIDALAAEDGLDGTGADRSRMHGLIEETVLEFRAWVDGHAGRAAADVLTERAERERLAELDQLWQRMPMLDPEARTAIERMSQHLATRLLREPLERLGRDVDGRAERAARELFAL